MANKASIEVEAGIPVASDMRATRGRYIAIVDPRRWAEAMAKHEAIMQAFKEARHGRGCRGVAWPPDTDGRSGQGGAARIPVRRAG
jgi:hypothetical protein